MSKSSTATVVEVSVEEKQWRVYVHKTPQVHSGTCLVHFHQEKRKFYFFINYNHFIHLSEGVGSSNRVTSQNVFCRALSGS